jgi:type II secretory pathway pseudopilin PulG
MIQRLRSQEHPNDAGVSLIELIVSMGIFVSIMGIITAAVMSMMGQTRKELGQSDNLDSARKIIQNLDQSVRYANAVTTPGTGTDGAYYVEYRTGNTGQQQTCWQWRYVPSTSLVQVRHWLPPVAGVGSTSPTAWVLEGTGISLVGATPIWSITPNPPVPDNVHQELIVSFNASHGAPVTSQANQVTLTAINTASSSPLSSVCNEVGRP